MGKVADTVKTKLYPISQMVNEIITDVDGMIGLIENVDTIPRNDETITVVSHTLGLLWETFALIERTGDRNFGDRFWRSQAGVLLMRGYRWLYGGDLIGLKEAACLLFNITPEQYSTGNKWRVLINTLTAGRYGKPQLRAFYDEDQPYGQNVRVLRSQVQALKDSGYKVQKRTKRARVKSNAKATM